MELQINKSFPPWARRTSSPALHSLKGLKQIMPWACSKTPHRQCILVMVFSCWSCTNCTFIFLPQYLFLFSFFFSIWSVNFVQLSVQLDSSIALMSDSYPCKLTGIVFLSFGVVIFSVSLKILHFGPVLRIHFNLLMCEALVARCCSSCESRLRDWS